MKYILVIFILWSTCSMAQITEKRWALSERYNKCLELYNEACYAGASQLLVDYMDELSNSSHVNRNDLLKKSELLYAKCAVKMEKINGEQLITSFVNSYSPEPIASGALLEMANFYFNNKEYENAEKYFNKINGYSLGKEEKDELLFKRAYLLFAKKQFASAKSKFGLLNRHEGPYYQESSYYYGLCEFYQNNYDQAIKEFKKLESSRRYNKYIPFYISQILFKQKQYNELIQYATQQLDDNHQLRNRNEINQLIGQSYFELGDYSSALPYFQYFIERENRLRIEDFYQAGFVYYQNKKYNKAKRYFEQLGSAESEISQNGLYHLADCYIKLGDKNSARNAFFKVSQWDYNTEIQDISAFNYAKLSYELNYDNDAIAALQNISNTSAYYKESQELLSQLFLDSKNYKKSEDILSKMDNKSPALKRAYQRVKYYRGLEEVQDQNWNMATSYFLTVSKSSHDSETQAKSCFWLGDILHREAKYQESANWIDKYFLLSRGMEMDEFTDEALALYIQGYNFIKQLNYSNAKDYFNRCIVRLNRNKYQTKYIKDQILPDAYLRLGDCYFKENDYAKALNNYNQVNMSNNQNYVYALYQKSIIKGLKGNRVDKLIDLERITEKYQDSNYADDALYELGISYLEIGELNKGRIPLEKLVQNYKNRSDLINNAYLKLGLVAYNQGSTSGAIEYYKSCLENNPSSSERQNALIALKEIYIDDLGEPDSYFALIENTTGQSTSESAKDSLTYSVAQKKFDNADYKGAITAFSKYLSQFPRGIFAVEALFYRGESNFVEKDYDSALADYRSIILKGQSVRLEKSLKKAALISYNHQEDFEEALKYYVQLDKVAQSQEKRFLAEIGAMRSAYKVGNTTILEEMAQKVISNALANNEQKGIAHYYLGKMNYDRRKTADASKNFSETDRLISNVFAAEARYLMAEIEFQTGNVTSAKEKCMSANRANGAFTYWLAKGVILLSDILVAEGDYFNAQAALESLLENYSDDQDLITIGKAKLDLIKEKNSENILEEDKQKLEFDNN